jgi:hypothetical protein
MMRLELFLDILSLNQRKECNLHSAQGTELMMVCIVVRMLAHSSSVGVSGIISTKLCSTYQILLPFLTMVFEHPCAANTLQHPQPNRCVGGLILAKHM